MEGDGGYKVGMRFIDSVALTDNHTAHAEWVCDGAIWMPLHHYFKRLRHRVVSVHRAAPDSI